MKVIGGVKGPSSRFSSFMVTLEHSEFTSLCQALCLGTVEVDKMLESADGSVASWTVSCKLDELSRMDTQLADGIKRLDAAKEAVIKATELTVKTKGVRAEQKKQKETE